MKRIILEDTIMQRGQPFTAGAKILENTIAPIDATVVERLSGYEIIGRADVEDFGIPALSVDCNNTSAPRVSRPASTVQAVANDEADFALCNDLFGTYRRAAAENGLCYIHPTYGTVSRYGLIQMASSMDQIGIICKNIPDGLALLSQIGGCDPKDGTMFADENNTFAPSGRSITIGIPSDIVAQATLQTQEMIRHFTADFRIVSVPLPYFNAYASTMYILSAAEISSNISRYDGVKYGRRAASYTGLDDMYLKTRTEGLGLNAKLTALMGAMVLSQDYYGPRYDKAMRVRRLIKEALSFEQYDLIALPCHISDDPYVNLALSALPQLAGLPSVIFGGIQLIANVKDENTFLEVAQ